jgi:hypothetical protein
MMMPFAALHESGALARTRSADSRHQRPMTEVKQTSCARELFRYP